MSICISLSHVLQCRMTINLCPGNAKEQGNNVRKYGSVVNLAFFVHNCKPMVFRSRNVVLVVLVGIKGLLSVWECVENDAINCFYNFCRMLLKLKYKSYIKIP